MFQTIYNYLKERKDVCIFEIYDLYKCTEFEDTDKIDNVLYDLLEDNLIEYYKYFGILFLKIKALFP